MWQHTIHIINQKTDSLTTRPLYLKCTVYPPLAGLAAVTAAIPSDQYDVVLTNKTLYQSISL